MSRGKSLKAFAAFLSFAICTATATAQPIVNILDQEVSVGLQYTMGWAQQVFQDSATAQSDGLRPIVLQLGGEAQDLNFRTGPQKVKTDLTASGSMAYNLQTGTAPSLFATVSGNIAVEAAGDFSTAQGIALSSENWLIRLTRSWPREWRISSGGRTVGRESRKLVVASF